MKSIKRLGAVRFGALTLVGALLITGGYALTASNTVPSTLAGSGSGTISGYTVSAVHYTLNSTNPQNIDSVSFTVDTAPVAGGTLKVKLVSSGSTYYTCTNTGTAVTCNTTTPVQTVASADQLLVVAAQ